MEKKAAQILTKTLESLSEKRHELKFESETNIEIGEKPKFDEKDFRESIFSYILYTINILCNDVVSKKFKIKYFPVADLNLKKILSFLTYFNSSRRL